MSDHRTAGVATRPGGAHWPGAPVAGMLAVVCLAAALVVGPPARAASWAPHRPGCLGRVGTILRDGGFGLTLDCRDYLWLTYIGRFKAVGHRYALYDFEYAHREGGMDGGEVLVVLRDGSYLGLYPTDNDPRLRLRGTRLRLWHDGSNPMTVDFRNGPPKVIHFRGPDPGDDRPVYFDTGRDYSINGLPSRTKAGRPDQSH